MKRIFGAHTYGDGPRAGCWWDETCALPSTSRLETDASVDVAVMGGGFTGVSAALTLAEKGVRVAVLEAHDFGWGASGRNGGFCCLGGAKASDSNLDATYGRDARIAYRGAELQAVRLVEQLIDTHDIDVDRHSDGETQLAHRPKDLEALRLQADAMFEDYDVTGNILQAGELEDHGMRGGPFHGALTIPVGFALNPRKYLGGLMRAAIGTGAALYSASPVRTWRPVRGGGHVLSTARAQVKADQVVVATNGYSSEHLPEWLAARYMPAQSTVLVTRPLSETERAAQGWTSRQMCFDTRHMLHYFRLMPDRRFLFGMRGGLLSGARSERISRQRVRAHFEALFPAWADVPSEHSWSGLVALARNRLPFAGPVPGQHGAWAALCYHGNGVAMGTLAGRMVAEQACGGPAEAFPSLMRLPLTRFPFGGARRVLMPMAYAGLWLRDRL